MTQKQILGIVVGVVGLGIVFLFIYGQFTKPVSVDSGVVSTTAMRERQTDSSTNEGVATAKEVVIPETIDDISLSIESETDADLSALDAEENGAVSDIEADSQSVNNLGTSYDENNL